MNYYNLKRKLAKNIRTCRAEFGTQGKYDRGEIWFVDTNNDDFSQLVILEKFDDNIIRVAPLCHWTEHAGAEDVFMPLEALGTEIIVMLELEFNLLANDLKQYRGKLHSLDLEYILNARKSLEDNISNDFKWGWEYFENEDINYKYHSDFATEIEKLQRGLRRKIFNEYLNAGKPLVEDFKAWASVKNNIIPFANYAKNNIYLPQAAGDGDSEVSKCIILDKTIPELLEQKSGNAVEGKGVAIPGVNFEPLNPEYKDVKLLQWYLDDEHAVNGSEFVFAFDRITKSLIGTGTVVIDGKEKYINLDSIFYTKLERIIEKQTNIILVIVKL